MLVSRWRMQHSQSLLACSHAQHVHHIFLLICAAKLALKMLWRLHLSLNSNASDENSNSSNSTTSSTSSTTSPPALDVAPTATTNNERQTQTGVESSPASVAPSAANQVDSWLEVLRGVARFAGHRSPHICYKAIQAVARLML